MGPYDLVAVINVEALSDVPSVISSSVRGVVGIKSTTTCIAFPEG